MNIKDQFHKDFSYMYNLNISKMVLKVGIPDISYCIKHALYALTRIMHFIYIICDHVMFYYFILLTINTQL